MHPLRSTLLALVLALAPTAALAQPGAPPPPPPGQGGGYYGYGAPPPLERQGVTFGLGFGFGAMEDDSGPIECFDCSYSPLAGSFDLHVGGMLRPELALLGELWFQGQTLDSTGANALVQSMAMVALQYWLTPQLWIKGGLGVSRLDLSYDDGYAAFSDTIDTGGAVLGAIGYEVFYSPRFAIDLGLRLGAGTYDGIDEQISTVILGVGFNWYQ